MERITKTINSRQLISIDTIGIKTNNISIDTTDTIDSSKQKYEPDHLFEMMSELVNDTFRAWYCGVFYKLGRERVLKIASIARQDGKDKRKYFTYLLKQELKQLT